MNPDQLHSQSEPLERSLEERAILEAHLHEMLDRIEALLADEIQGEREIEEYANATHEYVLGLIEQMRLDDPEIAAKINAADAIDTQSPIMRYIVGEISRALNTRLSWRRTQINSATNDAARDTAEEQFTNGMRKLVSSLIPKFKPPRPINYGRPAAPPPTP